MLDGVEAVAAEEIGADERGIRLDEVRAAHARDDLARLIVELVPVIAEAGRRVPFER